MRSAFALFFIITILFGGGYLYQLASSVCRVPIAYSIGFIDERFDLEPDEINDILARAEAVWESPTERELFVYDESSDFVINFRFDERQQLTEAEIEFRERLESAQSTNQEIGNTYESLISEYEAIKNSFDARRRQYETDLEQYNQIVNEHNQAGGAPPDAFQALEDERSRLEAEGRTLHRLIRNINELAEKINLLSEQGNAMVESYNRGVAAYNQTFGVPRRFTQGEYERGGITVYSFANRDELTLVLAHEFGHALGIGHVDGEESVMHYLIGGQREDLSLSTHDEAAFAAICTERSTWDIIRSMPKLFKES